jgi:glycosyltransferase involved in cell wall biosynthesis
VRLLVLSPLLPRTGASGGQTRELHLLRRLAELGHEVVVCCPVPAAQRDFVEAGLDVRAAHRPSRATEVVTAVQRRPALAALLVSRPLASWQLEVLWEGMRPAVEEELGRRRPDAALVVWDLAAAWREHLPPGLPTAIDLHDVSWEYVRSRAQTRSGPAAAALRLESARLRRFTRRRLPRYDAVVCVSEAEAARVRAVAPGAPAPAVVPNGVDLAAFAPAPEPDGPPTVLFTGTMNYPPNADGALWLASEVWPRVRGARPGARLLIVGRDPGRAVQRLDGRDGIEVAGGVPDMAPYFAAAHVVAVPIRSGGGTRLKVLEAAASGRAVVSTRLGAEGLELRAGTEIVLADEPGAFAEALLGLLADPARRGHMAAAGRAAVEARYGWPALGDRLADVLERVAAPTARARSAGTASSTSAASRK